MTKTHGLIALLLITDVLAIATRKTPFVINREKEHVAAAVKEAETKALSVLAIRNHQMMTRIKAEADSIKAEADSLMIRTKRKLPLTPVERIIRIHCTKSGYSRTITDGTKLRYEWKENYLMVMNGDSITVFGRFMGDDCEVTRGNI